MEKSNKKNGFSLVETVIVISILAIVSFVSFAYLNGTKITKDLNQAEASLIGALELARSHAINGMGESKDDRYGVEINGNDITVFKEGTGEILAEFPIPNGVSTDKTGETILFNRIRANTDKVSDFVITITHNLMAGLNKIITVTPEGKIER